MSRFIPPQLRSEYNYPTDAASLASGIAFDPEEDQTVQADAKEADINEIVRRFGITGQLPEPRAGAEYGDFSEVSDFQTAMNAVVEAQESFNALPAKLRERFSNDPAKFLEFVHDPDNVDESVRLGLLHREEAPADPSPSSADPSVDPPSPD